MLGLVDKFWFCIREWLLWRFVRAPGLSDFAQQVIGSTAPNSWDPVQATPPLSASHCTIASGQGDRAFAIEQAFKRIRGLVTRVATA
jgi:hypothetical protein